MSPPTAAAAGSAVCVVRAAHGTGEGFAFLEPHWIVTARHVVRDQGVGDPVALMFGGGMRSSASIATLHPHVDLAVLHVTGDARGVVPLRPPAEHLDVAEPAFCLASDARGSPDEVARNPALLLEVRGFERTRRHRDGREEDLFIFPAPSAGSPRSGGPLLAADGTVVGVIVDSIDLAGCKYIRATAIEVLLPSFEMPAADPPR